jgi:hypothetical protein
MSRGQLHLASYSLILTQSISSDFWAAQGVQPLYFRKPEDWATETETPHRYDPATLDRRLEKFDHIWGCRLDEAHQGYVESRGELVARGDACALWRVRR